jgi:hypothetical protein
VQPVLFLILSAKNKQKHTPWPESGSKLYRPSDCRLSVKLVPTFADRGVSRSRCGRSHTAVISVIYTVLFQRTYLYLDIRRQHCTAAVPTRALLQALTPVPELTDNTNTRLLSSNVQYHPSFRASSSANFIKFFYFDIDSLILILYSELCMSSTWYLPFAFLDRNYARISHHSHVCYIHHASILLQTIISVIQVLAGKLYVFKLELM